MDAAIEFLIAEREWDEDDVATSYEPNTNVLGKSHISDSMVSLLYFILSTMQGEKSAFEDMNL